MDKALTKNNPLKIEGLISGSRERGKRLRRIRNLANFSRKDLFDKYGINPNTLKGWELGRHGGLTENGAKTILQICKMEGIECELNWLLYGIGTSPSVIGEMELPFTNLSKPKDLHENIKNEILFFKKNNENSVAILVRDDGMHPLYKQGEYVAGIKKSGSEIQKLIGVDCIVQLKTGEILLRNLHEGSTKNVYTLVCHNSHAKINKPVLYDIELDFAAPVIWHRRTILC